LHAAESLGHLGQASPKVVTALLHALDAEDAFVRLHAAESLGHLGQASPKSLFEKYQAASRLSINRVIATYTNVSLVLGNSS
jgi:HEAT repeat protein